jgi:hypothetical protein
MPDIAGIHPVTQQMMQNEPDKKAKDNGFEKRGKVDGSPDNQVLKR